MISKKFSSVGKGIELIIDDDSLIDALQLGKYIPEMKECGCVSDYRIKYVRGDAFLGFGRDEVICRSRDLFRKDVMALLSRSLEYLFFKDRIYSVHSTSVYKGGHMVLFPGRSGSGKTNLQMKIAENNDDISLFSCDRTVIEGKTAISGTKVLNINNNSLERYFSNIKEKVVTLPGDTKSTLGEEVLEYRFYQGTAEIGAIVHPFVTDSRLEANELKADRKLRKMANNSFYFIDEFPRLMLGPRKVIQTPVELKQKDDVLERIYDLVSSVPNYEVSGRLEDVKKWAIDNVMA